MTIEDKKYELRFNIRLTPIERLFRKKRIEHEIEELRKSVKFIDPHSKVIHHNVNGSIVVTVQGTKRSAITKTEQELEIICG